MRSPSSLLTAVASLTALGLLVGACATGDGKTLDNGDKSTFCVSKGDRVLFTSYAGTDVKHDGAEYIIMREDDILAIIG